MHPNTGKKQSPEHIAKRMASMRKHQKWPGGHPPKYTAKSLWEKVKKGGNEECWPWLGFCNDQGYGRVWINGRGYYAHRVIYQLANPGTIRRSSPKNKNAYGFLRHKCDNPVCCNPLHLEIGTHADNMRDKVERGRSKWFDSSIDSPRAKLTAAQVLEIRGQPKESRLKLAAKYGVSIQTIKAVRSRRHYADIT
jgi:hypothetical protein